MAAVITVPGSRKLETDDVNMLQLAATYPTEPPEVCSYHIEGDRQVDGDVLDTHIDECML